MALEIAMDEMAERLNLDPVEFRIRNDTQVDPGKPERPFSHRNLIGCMKLGPSGSAGPSATRSRAKCATGSGWWVSAWRRGSATTC